MNKESKKCVICGKNFTEIGNNPFPIKKEGECCDKCNLEKVIPARINMLKNNSLKDQEINMPLYNELKNKILNANKDNIENIKNEIEENHDKDLLNEQQYYNLLKGVNIMKNKFNNIKFKDAEKDIDFEYLLEEERKAVEDYRAAIAKTTDHNAIYVLSHILKEEAHHIELLEKLKNGKIEFTDAFVKDEDEDEYSEFYYHTYQNKPIHSIYEGKDKRLYAIAKEDNPRGLFDYDWIVGINYDTDNGYWGQGVYEFESPEKAKEYIDKVYKISKVIIENKEVK